MNTKLKTVFVIPAVVCLLALELPVFVSCICHPDPAFNIGNNFVQPVTVYFEGQKVGKVNPGESKIFYPNEFFTATNIDLLVELRSDSGVVLYSRLFTWDDLRIVLESVKGEPYWIGDRK
jgi:hypothetical protein